MACPSCGSHNVGKERVNGVDTGDIRCHECHEVWETKEDSSRTCRNPACKQSIPAQRMSVAQLDKRFEPTLRQGFVLCPLCQGKHRAENVQFISDGPFRGSFSYEFGEYVGE